MIPKNFDLTQWPGKTFGATGKHAGTCIRPIINSMSFPLSYQHILVSVINQKTIFQG